MSGYLYFIRSRNRLKIGYTVDVLKRWRRHLVEASGEHGTLCFLGCRKAKPSEEKRTQNELGLKRVNRCYDWFVLTPEAIAKIEAMDLKPLEEFGYAESVVPIGAALHRRLRIASKVYRYKIRAIVEAGIKLRLDELEQETFYKSQGGSSL